MAIHALSTPAPTRRLARRSRPSPTAPAFPNIPFPDVASIPPMYAMQLQGTCLEPELMDGDQVVFSRDEPIAVGDFCIFILKPELVRPGGSQCMIKRLVIAPAPGLKLPYEEHPESTAQMAVSAEQLNPPRQYMMRCSSLLAIHKFVRVQARQ